MKKIDKENLIELLINNNGMTYEELSKITGYHPKSLIRIKREIKKGKYNANNNLESKIGNTIREYYLNSNIKYYKDFYNTIKNKYNISYSMMCRILSSTTKDEEIVIIKKIKETGNYYFQVIDYQTKSILFTYPSEKNNNISIKKIIYKLLNTYGIPKNISLINVYKEVPESLKNLLIKYSIFLKEYKPIYRINNLNNTNNDIKYQKVIIDKRDFYNCIVRKVIDDNTIQFHNTRYEIIAQKTIKKLSSVLLYYNDYLTDLFIVHNNSSLNLKPIKKLISKKGESKY